MGGNFSGGDFPGGNFPRTLGNNHDRIAVTNNVPNDKHSLILRISAQI